MSDGSERYVIADGGLSDGLSTNPGGRLPREDSTPTPEFDPSVDEVVEAVLGLGSRDRDVFRALVADPGSTTSDLAQRLDLHRSNVNRSLTDLVGAGLVTRRRRILETGGHVYQYTVPPPEELGERFQERFEAWTAVASDRLEEFVHEGETDAERQPWVERLVLRVTGLVTPTEEYVFYHGVARRRRQGRPVPDAVERGEWSPEIRAEFVAEGSRERILTALERLRERGHVETVDPEVRDDWNGPYWRLTGRGRERRDEILDEGVSP